MFHKCLALVGPTASGKSGIAIELAKKYNGEIISCDSRQIYRGMDTGTGKVIRDEGKGTREQREGARGKAQGASLKTPEMDNGKWITENKNPIPNSKFQIPNSDEFFSEKIRHWMIDIVHPNTPYNVVKFQKKANHIIKDILNRGKLPILCGGTGLWAQAVVENMTFPEILPDTVLRNRLRSAPTDALFRELQTFNPERARTIDSKNRHRLIRAIEIAQEQNMENGEWRREKGEGRTKNGEQKTENGNSLSDTTHYSLLTTHSSQTTHAPLPPTHWLVLAVNLPRETLFAKIEKRLDERLADNMILEVELLHTEKKISWTRLDAFGLEYRWISRYLQKKISFEEMREKLLIDIRHYAKRQLTWLRRWEKMGRNMYFVSSASEAEETIKKFLEK